MNEVVCISTFVLLCFAVAFASRYGLKQLYVVSVFIILASNITVGIQVDAFGVSVSLGVIIYSLIYLVTDIVSEFYRKHEAYKLAVTNLAVQVALWVYVFISIQVQASGGHDAYQAMEGLFTSTARITIAAFVASLGAFADIWFYEFLLRKAKQEEGERFKRRLWLRNILSTFIGQSVNTALFFTIALYGVVPNLGSIILAAIGIKWAIAVLDTPFLYWARRLQGEANQTQHSTARG